MVEIILLDGENLKHKQHFQLLLSLKIGTASMRVWLWWWIAFNFLLKQGSCEKSLPINAHFRYQRTTVARNRRLLSCYSVTEGSWRAEACCIQWRLSCDPRIPPPTGAKAISTLLWFRGFFLNLILPSSQTRGIQRPRQRENTFLIFGLDSLLVRCTPAAGPFSRTADVSKHRSFSCKVRREGDEVKSPEGRDVFVKPSRP